MGSPAHLSDLDFFCHIFSKELFLWLSDSSVGTILASLTDQNFRSIGTQLPFWVSTLLKWLFKIKLLSLKKWCLLENISVH